MQKNTRRVIEGGPGKIEKAMEFFGALSKRCQDYLLNPSEWQADTESLTLRRMENNGESLHLTERSLTQLSERLGAGTYLSGLVRRHNNGSNEREKEVLQHLFAHNINMLKTLTINPLLFRLEVNGRVQVRAVLSNQYVVLNNYDLLVSCLETVRKESEKYEVPIDQIKFDYETDEDYSDIRFYFINEAIRFGDNYRGGIVVKNGECGDSGFEVTLILFNSSCSNVIRTQIRHGLRHAAERVFRYSDITNRLQADLVYRKASELTRVLFNRSELEKYYQALIQARDVPMDQDKAQILMERHFSDQRVQAILDLWKTKEEPNLYGLSQAITYSAQEQSFKERERDEEFAGQLVFK